MRKLINIDHMYMVVILSDTRLIDTDYGWYGCLGKLISDYKFITCRNPWYAILDFSDKQWQPAASLATRDSRAPLVCFFFPLSYFFTKYFFFNTLHPFLMPHHTALPVMNNHTQKVTNASDYTVLQVCRPTVPTDHYRALQLLPVTTGFVGKFHCLLMFKRCLRLSNSIF